MRVEVLKQRKIDYSLSLQTYNEPGGVARPDLEQIQVWKILTLSEKKRGLLQACYAVVELLKRRYKRTESKSIVR